MSSGRPGSELGTCSLFPFLWASTYLPRQVCVPHNDPTGWGVTMSLSGGTAGREQSRCLGSKAHAFFPSVSLPPGHEPKGQLSAGCKGAGWMQGSRLGRLSRARCCRAPAPKCLMRRKPQSFPNGRGATAVVGDLGHFCPQTVPAHTLQGRPRRADWDSARVPKQMPKHCGGGGGIKLWK